MMTRMAFLALVILAGTSAGCRNELETGYVPRRLGSSDTERRGFYARPFSQEAYEAQMRSGPDRRPDYNRNF